MMVFKKYSIFLLLVIFTFTSCKVLLSRDPIGVYAYKDLYCRYTLNLLNDSKFEYSESIYSCLSHATGKYFVHNDTLLLVSVLPELGSDFVIESTIKDNTLEDGLLRISFVLSTNDIKESYQKGYLSFYYQDNKSLARPQQIYPIDTLSCYSPENTFYTLPIEGKNDGVLILRSCLPGCKTVSILTLDVSELGANNHLSFFRDYSSFQNFCYDSMLTGVVFLIRKNTLVPLPTKYWDNEFKVITDLTGNHSLKRVKN